LGVYRVVLLLFMSNDNDPPPLSVPAKPIQYAHFEGSKTGIHTAGFDRDRLDSTRKQAQDWINQNLNLEVISVDSAFGNLLRL